jgi:Predicted metalloendopeptidase
MSNEILARVLDGADPAVRVQDDLFRAVNGSWIKNKKIPADLTGYGSLVKLRLESEANVRSIIEDLASSAPEGDAKKISDLFSSWMDTEKLNSLGVAPLNEDFALVEAASNHEELAEAVGTLMSTGVASFFSAGVGTDINDPTRYVTFISQSGLGLPDEAYYREEQHAKTLGIYKDFIPDFLELCGASSAASATQAETILRLEKEFASTHMTLVDRRDPEKYNNPFKWADFIASAPGFAWERALRAMGAPMEKIDSVLVSTPKALTASAAIWARTGLDDLKAYTRWRILRARATFLTEEIDEANFDFYGRVLGGSTEQRERWKRGVAVVEDSLGEALGREYAARHFPPEHKEKMLQLVGDLLEAYRRSIRDLDWMGEETKAKALAKVEAFSLKIGYPDTWRDYSNLTIGNDLVENIRATNRWENARDFAKLGGPVDKSEWLMFPQTVNAYYYPVWNEIVFPAAILQFPFFDPDRDAALNYGAIGAVIGHEIGHGFDDQGSKFDADGAIRNWWTDADRAAFDERTRSLVSQYDAYIPSELGPDGPHVNGHLTLGENIGDLGGLSIALKAYGIALEREGKTFDEADVIDGYTAVQRFFLSWARVWRFINRVERAETQLATDPHSPNEFRTNGVVKNIDAFAEAFGLQPGDGLYLPPEERVRIW